MTRVCGKGCNPGVNLSRLETLRMGHVCQRRTAERYPAGVIHNALGHGDIWVRTLRCYVRRAHLAYWGRESFDMVSGVRIHLHYQI